VEQHHKDGQSHWLGSIGRFPYGTAALFFCSLQLAPDLKPDIHDEWLSAIENAFLSPMGSKDDLYTTPFEVLFGLGMSRPIALAGVTLGRVPVCPQCDVPADRVLFKTSEALHLPFGLRRDLNPRYYC